jgi:hypothetical protein
MALKPGTILWYETNGPVLPAQRGAPCNAGLYRLFMSDAALARQDRVWLD